MARSSVRTKSSPSGAKDKAQKTDVARIAAPAPKDFVQAFYDNVLAADLADFSASDREHIAASIWNLAQNLKPKSYHLRLYNPSPVKDGWTVDHSVIELVHDDMPFLVDSVSGTLQKRGLTIHLTIHPVLYINRDATGKILGVAKKGNGHPESFMHIQMDHCLDPELLKEIEAEIHVILKDVRASVEDWPKMRQRMEESIAQAAASKHNEAASENTEETKAFLRWLNDNNFTYLGYRDIDLVQEGGKLSSIKVLPESGLGVLRNPEIRMFGGLRDRGAKKTATLQRYVQQHHLLVVTKTNQTSHVHRIVPMDAIFVRRFNTQGDIVGERLFVGLFTSRSYSQNPHQIPFLRLKIAHVQKRAGFDPNGHDGKALIHILNTYPHDELFQINEDELLQNSLGILQLQERARVALFARRDPFERFATVLLYVPRDRYDSALRDRLQSFLESAYKGKAEDWNVRIDDSQLARVFVTIQLSAESPHPDLTQMEKELREMCRGWTDRLRDCLVGEYGEATALALLRRYGSAFPATYRDLVAPPLAVHDIHNLERGKTLDAGHLIVDLSPADDQGLQHLKLFQIERPIGLSNVLPLIENFGLKVEYMNGPYEIKPKDSSKSVFVHEFVGRPSHPLIADFHHIKPAFEEAFGKVWTGELENDAFNALTLRAGMAGHEVQVLRDFARYLRQLRIPYSHEMMAATFLNHARVAQQLYALFFARHDPDLKGNREKRCKDIEDTINDMLGKIEALEEDRIVRRYLNLVHAALRTNYFQMTKEGTHKSYLSIKFDSRAVEFMPLPKPLYEIFVYSPRTEAVHLRGGKVARGGIRWSDRRDDFRNEILGLMKAQMVKNSVIVPVGSKGGFIVKRPPLEADKFQAEGIACYRIMMCGLLDITDNRSGNKIIPPERVVRHDADDPYLVVAADKGTAKFSDIANGISQEFGFWLDDAFASGGSAGYDHKEMGITARGAWEAVKRHFRELGKDIQTTDFTCVGVGDMSGDVFGNGMLLSKHTRLLAAFDHRHIFCDPNPDAAVSYGERARLFKLPRSSWADYDAKKISKGGGIFPRSEKFIKISPEMKKAYGIVADSLPPADLIQALLKADVELLYFGGIGTYIKASDESHESIGDRATEALRVDGQDVRAKIIGEGANLGATQRGRIEYALKGGHINTDAIDNSAGVDTSDHEVNIKILLRKLVIKGSLPLAARNKLLPSMTDDVARLVLRDNYLQTQALSVAEAQAYELLPQHTASMYALEKSGLLNRAVEFLPESSEIADRQRSGKGLTRPELAVLLAYAKIAVYQQLLDSDLPDDEAFLDDLAAYFPSLLAKKYESEIPQHQLRREIIATGITNSIINRAGSHFIINMAERTGRSIPDIVRAYLIARGAFGFRNLWHEIEALDNKVPAKVQTHMLLTINQTMAAAVHWFLSDGDLPAKLGPVTELYAKGIERLVAWLEKRPAEINGRFKKAEEKLSSQGVPASLAQHIAMMPVLASALDLTRLSKQSGCSIELAAEVFFGLGHRLSLDWLAEHANAIVAQTPMQREAVDAVLDELTATQRRIAEIIIGKCKDNKTKSDSQRLFEWTQRNAGKLESYDAIANEWRSSGTVDVAMLTLASRRLAALLK
ncbi:MAG: NAD-glutamate dehydrogenase [Alphaproteobacteria bacterium]